MIVRRFYDTKLAQASYLVGCGRTGSALVVDPNRDVEQYVRAAREEGVTVTHVTETHIHADFVSGARELAHATGATLYLSDEGDENWKYAYAKEAKAQLVKDGDTIKVGNVKAQVIHTPGHTPEHVSFLITDTAAADEPIGMLTGDFVFVGDVGRPDLLEKAAKVSGTMEGAARTQFRSLQKFKQQPDWLQIWPGHGAGSACGKGLSAVPHSTVGYERRFNWAFKHDDEGEFVKAVLAGQPEPPKYFAEMKRINKEGPRLLSEVKPPQRLQASELQRVLESGAMVVDTRTAAEFAAGYVPGTINIPLGKSFTTWAGWLIPYDRDFHVIVDEHDRGRLQEATRDLSMIGLDRLTGYFDTGAVEAWRQDGRELGTVPQMTPKELADRMRAGDVAVIDVRGRGEWDEGHIPGVENLPLGYLGDRAGALPTDKPVVVHCQTGGRSAIGASLLHARGLTNAVNLTGGFAEWEKSGQAVERGTPAETAASTR